MTRIDLSLTSIPHRPPFLFIDEIIEVSADRIVARKLADPDADYFRGHYPGNPVMPGVLLCECCFQAGALLAVYRLGAERCAEGMPVVTRIKDARFRRLVRPGDLLTIEVTLDECLDEAFFFTGRAYVNERDAVRVSFACMQVNGRGQPDRSGVV